MRKDMDKASKEEKGAGSLTGGIFTSNISRDAVVAGLILITSDFLQATILA